MITPFEQIQNSEHKCLCLLLLDTSGSMAGRRIEELNAGLKILQQQLADSPVSQDVELSIVSFGPVETKMRFTSAQSFYPPQLEAIGATPMGEAIERGLSLLDDKKNNCRARGIGLSRPLVLLITDGASTDSVYEAKRLIHTGEDQNEFMFYPVGFEGANMAQLADLSVRAPLELTGLAFPELFRWLSLSLRTISCGEPDDDFMSCQNLITSHSWSAIEGLSAAYPPAGLTG
jgi:uncharacterized protein YegL